MEVAVSMLLFFKQLNLDAIMLYSKVFAQDCVCGLQDELLLAILIRMECDVDRQAHLVIVQRPNVHIMDESDTLDSLEASDDLIRVNVIRSRLQNQHEAFPESLARGPKDDDSEKVCADWVDHPEVRPEEHNCSSDNHTY